MIVSVGLEESLKQKASVSHEKAFECFIDLID